MSLEIHICDESRSTKPLKTCFFHSNALVDYMLDGTAIKEAIENGKNLNGVKDCDSIYPGCPLNKEQTLNIIGKLLPSAPKQ